MKNLKLVLSICSLIFITSCEKDDENNSTTSLSNTQIQNNILQDFSQHIALATYQEMENKMNNFYSACLSFDGTQSQINLDNARNAWKDVRGTWEQSEAFLFGPVSTNNIDPSTDTWPVDYASLDSLLATGNSFTQSFVNSLGDELKGYHPAEYLLWGTNGNKTPSAFTVREREYLIALSADLQIKATSLRASWDPAVLDNYSEQIVDAGKVNSIYPSQKAVFEELVNAMIGICDEVANGKIYDPFTALDPSLEESPFSQNSLIDFKNNIQGVKNVYFGKYNVDGSGLNDFISKNNLALHNSISTDIENALNSFNGITVPFGQAISSQPTQVQNVINQINTLKSTLELELLPFVQQNIAN